MRANRSLLDLRPELLADHVDPAEVEAALRKARSLGSAQQQALAYALGHWVGEVLGRPADLDGTLLLDRICALAANLAGTSGAAAGFASRMQTLRELLENKRQAIEARKGLPAPMQAQAVIEILRTGPCLQRDLARRLKLTPGRISQLLATMEERGMIERERRGPDGNEVRLPGHGRKPTDAATPQPKKMPGEEPGTRPTRGLDVLLRPAA